MKLFYYFNYLALKLTPRFLLNMKKRKLERKFENSKQYVAHRVAYYLKHKNEFDLSSRATSITGFKHRGQSQYVIDLMSVMAYFPSHFRFRYHFGDETHIEDEPTLFKARPIDGDNQNSVLMKLVKYRHFRFVEDSLSFGEKKDVAVFRGAVTQPHRIEFMQRMFGHPLVDAAQSNPSNEHPEWQQPFMSVEEQLKNKFIICLEGNDVASNLKWAMSSNSVVVTPKMKFETWFMEGRLQPGVHYVEVADDWSDFEQKIQYYLDHPEEAEEIVKHAHEYIAPFRDEELEQLICIKTLERYFELSGQVK
ncbi:glycosyl transferase family 90 [Vibrio astriarenae]